jgi:hypothetical protein
MQPLKMTVGIRWFDVVIHKRVYQMAFTQNGKGVRG